MTPDEQDTLRRLFWLPNDSRDRLACDVLYDLAKGCPAGTDIILLGAATGLAAICLAFGARAGNKGHVFCLSDTPEQQADFIANTCEAHIRDYVSWAKTNYGSKICTYRKAAREHRAGVGLIVWDTKYGPELLKDFAAWQDKVVEGGLFVIHGNRAAWPMLVDYAVAGGMWVKGMVYPQAGIGTLRKWE